MWTTPNTPGRKSAIWISNTLHKVEGQLNILILLSWHGQVYLIINIKIILIIIYCNY
jgi:hypothetical protein